MNKATALQLLGTLGTATVAGLMTAGEANAIIIDDFNTETQTVQADQTQTTFDIPGVTDTDGPTAFSGTDLANALRELKTEQTNTQSSNVGIIGTVNSSDNGLLNVSSDVSVDGVTTLTYTPSSGTFDLTDGGNISLERLAFGFDIISSDLDGLDLTAAITSGTQTATFTNTLPAAPPTLRAIFEVSDFTNNENVNFAIVDEIVFTLDTPAQGQLSLDTIEAFAIPFEAETSAGLALLGSWAVWKRWKSRRSSAN